MIVTMMTNTAIEIIGPLGKSRSVHLSLFTAREKKNTLFFPVATLVSSNQVAAHLIGQTTLSPPPQPSQECYSVTFTFSMHEQQA